MPKMTWRFKGFCGCVDALYQPIQHFFMSHPVQAVFFDLFATLISVSKAAGGRGRYTADILGLDREQWNTVCFSDRHDICGPTSQLEIIRKLAHSLDASIPMHLIREVAWERQRRFDHALLHLEREILEALAALKERGIRLGLISNASTDEVRAWPDSPARPFFDSALFSCECGLKKPDPAIYRLGLSRLDVEARHALFVGDGGSQEHLGAARSGIRSLLSTHFLDTSSDEELRQREMGSVGRIGHIGELATAWVR